MNLGDGNHRLVQSINIARDDGLNGPHHAHHGHDRINTFMRIGPVTTFARDVNKGRVNRGHQGPRCGEKLPKRQVGRIVDAVDLGDLEPIHDPLFHHHLAPRPIFFGGLENKRHTARKAAGFGQIFCCPQKHGDMAVMPTSVHLARNG